MIFKLSNLNNSPSKRPPYPYTLDTRFIYNIYAFLFFKKGMSFSEFIIKQIYFFIRGITA
jgi:hypothetical protein